MKPQREDVERFRKQTGPDMTKPAVPSVRKEQPKQYEIPKKVPKP